MHRLLLAVLVCLPLAADSHQVTRQSYGNRSTTLEVFRQGARRRMVIEHDGTREVTLLDQAANHMYRLDVRAREYIESKPGSADLLTVLASAVERPSRVHQSGKSVTVSFETVDTGEQRSVFGQTARHLIVTERRVAEAGACERTRTSVTDGWYLAAPSSPREPYLSVGLRCKIA